MPDFELAHLVAIGIAVAAGLLLGRLLALPALRRAEAQLGEVRGEAERLRDEGAELNRRCATAEARADRVPALDARVEELGRSLMHETRRAEALDGQLRAARAEQQARLEELRLMGEEMDRKFGALAQKALSGNAESFLKLVSERFEKHAEASDADLGKRQVAIENLMKPVVQSLEKFENRIGEIEKVREGAYHAVVTHVRQLAEGQLALKGETSRLVQALRQPKTRGRWGEFQLRQVFEMAGMVEHVDFTSEHHIPGPDGARRPDAVVRLPGGKAIVVDSKTPLDAYLNHIEAVDDAGREQALRQHVRQIRAHVDGLAGKEYWNALPVTPDFVVMFVPGEAFYSAAIEHDPELFEMAIGKKVLISTPTTLIALVKAIAYGWQQEKLARNAQEVADLARQLYDRIQTFGEHMNKLGAALRSSVERYNRAVGSLEGRVLPMARRFDGLGVVAAGSAIDTLDGIDLEPRALTAAEFVAGEARDCAAGEEPLRELATPAK